MTSQRDYEMANRMEQQMNEVFEQFISIRVMYEKALLMISFLQAENPTPSELIELKSTEAQIIENQEKLRAEALRILDSIYNA